MMKTETHSQMMGEEPIRKLLWRFSLPAIVGMLVNALYNIVDSIFVGNSVGAIGLAAVTIAFPVMILMMGVGMLVGLGAAALVSIRIGEQKMPQAEKILGHALSLSVVSAVITTAAGLADLDTVLILLGASPDVLPYARDFTRIILWGSLPMYIGFGLNNLIRAAGHPRTAMGTMLMAAALNTVLNPLFIFGMGMGIRGSALATVLAQSVAAVWVIAFFCRQGSGLTLRWKNLRWELPLVKDICRSGLSPFLMQIGSSVIVFLYNYQLIQWGGETAVAVIGIINRMIMVLLMPVFGINQGVQPIIGYNYGARRLDRVREALKQAILAATAICTVGFVLSELFAAQILSLFSPDPALVAMGTPGMRISFCLLPLIGFQIVGSNYFQAVGQAGQAIFLTLVRQILLVIPLLLLLPPWFGLNGIWAVGPLTDIGCGLVVAYCLLKERRRLAALNLMSAPEEPVDLPRG
ncbi:MAG TPA: MATE family efflux transporter [Patescibacteria group bacterium]|nr:MATE family efflux transporter [Patescibacteria group bacterium]